MGLWLEGILAFCWKYILGPLGVSNFVELSETLRKIPQPRSSNFATALETCRAALREGLREAAPAAGEVFNPEADLSPSER
jgi:hypothetical protein